jgi:hypothetical protein
MPRKRLSRQAKPLPQLVFEAIHVAAVGFVIVTEKMQDAVENQDLEFDWQRTAEFFRVAACSGGRDCDVAESLGDGARGQANRTAACNGREGQDVSWPFLFAKGLIHAGNLRVGNQADGNFRFAQAQVTANPAKKQFQRGTRNAHCSLAIQNHPQ